MIEINVLNKDQSNDLNKFSIIYIIKNKCKINEVESAVAIEKRSLVTAVRRKEPVTRACTNAL